ncbi:MAG: hypothetical protein A2X17_00060 [Bacteroidetes bacterium GWF2_41_61]|nr:MAG: hypothetical protein A2X20_00565 [Bacteroidetes bacterium GWE2_40_15]OFY32136.1 MAG: hypothetical protein A2X17_00060 [Bacteroidetes bacterium GWF2_41_61]OFY91453.1 MAG: hypothetical protein A2266_09170 [Bacteroidetes bacterium RIFOXYA12_FULL_40_10]HBG23588.1 hypothetical protein [Rikenellaceae bacterium]HBZ26270.1 hypothetical protein [Rikenellaceae bacterium]
MRLILKYISIFVLLFALIIISSTKEDIITDRDPVILEGTEFKAIINIQGGIFLKSGHPVGFHFDLLNRFSEHQRCIIKIKPVTDCNPWEELALGRVDIVVANAGNDTIPDDYSHLFISSLELNEFEQVWVVTKENYNLLQNMNYWFGYFQNSKDYRTLVNNYYRTYTRVDFTGGAVSKLSPYDSIIKSYSSSIGWDWRLLASLIYQESKFSMGAKSKRGAYGLMQIRSATAKQFGIENIYDPEQNIKAGTLMIKRLLNLYKSDEIDSVNRVKFALAAYNAGEGRVDDIRRLAEHKGANPNDWESTKEIITHMKNSEKIPDGILKLGNFKGTETLKFVEEVLDRYENYKVLVR